MLVDETFDPSGSGCYELTRVHHADGHILRVRVRRDAYAQQSHAVAEVLTDAKTWTVLATSPQAAWYPGTPYTSRTAQPLVPIADGLLTRARAILTGGPHACPPEQPAS